MIQDILIIVGILLYILVSPFVRGRTKKVDDLFSYRYIPAEIIGFPFTPGLIAASALCVGTRIFRKGFGPKGRWEVREKEVTEI